MKNKKNVIVRWFYSDTASKVEEKYKDLAECFGLEVQKEDIAGMNESDRKEFRKKITKCINNNLSKSGHEYLLIFDNVINYEDIKDLLINLPGSAKVIITTKNRALVKGELFQKQINLEPFSQEEVEEYVKKSLYDSHFDPDEIARCIETCKKNPIPKKLELAVSYAINTLDSTVEDFIRVGILFH